MNDTAYELADDGDPKELDGAEVESGDLYDEGGVVTSGLPVAPPSRGPRTPYGCTCARSAACRSSPARTRCAWPSGSR